MVSLHFLDASSLAFDGRNHFFGDDLMELHVHGLYLTRLHLDQLLHPLPPRRLHDELLLPRPQKPARERVPPGARELPEELLPLSILHDVKDLYPGNRLSLRRTNDELHL